jgi:L-alanine-DL-glutamate epimerase-like enolase superfamily enzyme
MLSKPVTIDADGMLSVSPAPGLGIALDEEAVAFYSAHREVFRA